MKASPLFLTGLSLFFLTGFAVLTDALYRIQVEEVADYKVDLADQSTRRVRVPGRRGRILDRHGNVLAESRAARDAVCLPEAFRSHSSLSNAVAAIDREIGRFANIVGIPRTVTAAKIARHLRDESARPLVVARDLDDAALARFEERAADFPAFETVVRAERVYPFRRLAAHVLGYVGRDRPEAAAGTTIHYFEPEMRGRAGLESFYDLYLAGSPGDIRLTVNARGFTAGSDAERAPAPGLDLALTLDARLQLAAERELKGVCGACVVIDPRDGAVLALASAPAFDSNAFVPFISAADYRALADDPAHPLLNRAVSGLYAPGSTFKPITAIAALESGWNPEDSFDCSGVFRQTRCTAKWGHGPLTLRQALEKSCNPFFLQLGMQTGGERVLEFARAFGLGAKTGLDLYGEAAGGVTPWHFQSAMGQGPLLVTPLQMAVVCAAFANGGRLYRPYLHRHATGTPSPVSVIPATAEHLALVRLGMKDVVEEGSAWKAFHPRRDDRKFTLAVQAAGKTGSAEAGSAENRYKNTWFLAFAPFENPTLAVAMLVERGEFGGTTVAPRVYNLLKGVFGEKEVGG